MYNFALMQRPETMDEVFYNFDAPLTEHMQCRVAVIGEDMCQLTSYNRRDFYKISLITKGGSELLYASRGIRINGPALVFTNPRIPYSWEGNDTDTITGYFCVFTEEFWQKGSRHNSLQDLPLFKVGGEPVYLLDDEQHDYLAGIFSRMRKEVDSEYIYKFDLLRNQINLLIHEAIKMQPAVAYFKPQNAASRIAKLFLDLLERQFPIDAPRYALKLRKAGDYADSLAIHVNHLNAAVQELTGKSTTMHINEKILSEAKSLIVHTNWSIAEIALSLGFEYPSYFNNFFKKHAGQTPLALRKIL